MKLQLLSAQARAHTLCLVSDEEDRELMHVPLITAIRQGLYFRLVMVALHSDGKKALFLRQRPPIAVVEPGKWDLFTTPVRPDEAREDAALRVLMEECEIPVHSLAVLAQSTASPLEPFHRTLFSAHPALGVSGILTDAPGYMLLDADELEGLIEQEPDLCAATLRWAFKNGYLY